MKFDEVVEAKETDFNETIRRIHNRIQETAPGAEIVDVEFSGLTEDNDYIMTITLDTGDDNQ